MATTEPSSIKTQTAKPKAKMPVPSSGAGTAQPKTKTKAKAGKSGTKAAVKPKKPKTPKVKKPKLVRDSFTIPKNEYLALGELKSRAEALAHPAKKSELLRAGLMALTHMTDQSFLKALGAVPAIKTGRPKKG
jgi:hypothetical protein